MARECAFNVWVSNGLSVDYTTADKNPSRHDSCQSILNRCAPQSGGFANRFHTCESALLRNRLIRSHQDIVIIFRWRSRETDTSSAGKKSIFRGETKSSWQFSRAATHVDCTAKTSLINAIGSCRMKSHFCRRHFTRTFSSTRFASCLCCCEECVLRAANLCVTIAARRRPVYGIHINSKCVRALRHVSFAGKLEKPVSLAHV